MNERDNKGSDLENMWAAATGIETTEFSETRVNTGPGRPPAVIVDDAILAMVEQYASDGLTHEQIAKALGIHRDTLRKMKGRNAAFAAAVQKGRAIGMQTVANSLFENAKSGNVVAQIFYLKNRDPENWRDVKRVETEQSSADKALGELGKESLAILAKALKTGLSADSPNTGHVIDGQAEDVTPPD